MKTQRLLIAAVFLLGACASFEDLPNLPNDTPTEAPEASASQEPTQNATDILLPNPLDVASVSGLKGSLCSEESSLRSGSGSATKINFTNQASGPVNIYWLNQQGQRVAYKKGLAAGASYTQSTYVTHPWVITNAQDQCLGIYTPETTGTVTLTVNQIPEGAPLDAVVNTPTSGTTGTLAESDVTEERARQGIACLQAKGDMTNATTVEGLLGLYLQMKGSVGSGFAQMGYLAPAAKVLNQTGC